MEINEIKTKYRINSESKKYIEGIKKLMHEKYGLKLANKEVIESALARYYTELGIIRE